MSDDLCLFLVKRNGEWMATTKNGALCLVRRTELTPGSPVVRYSREKSTVRGEPVDVIDLLAEMRRA